MAKKPKSTPKHSYVYKITERSSGKFYIGYRTIPETRTPTDDLGVVYFTSGRMKTRFSEFPDTFDKEIIDTFKLKIDAYAYEQQLIEMNLKHRLCQNKRAIPVTDTTRIAIEYDQEYVEADRKTRRIIVNKRVKSAKAMRAYQRVSKHYEKRWDEELQCMVTIIP